MAQVVAFDAFAPRIARRAEPANRANGETVFGKVIVFTGVWHERVMLPDPADAQHCTAEPKPS